MITLPCPPSTNNLYMTLRRRRVMTPEARAFKQTAADAARRAGVLKTARPVVVDIDVFRPRKAGDIDNYAKICLDAMKGIAWVDDEQVVELHVRRFDDPGNPRAEMHINEKEASC